MINTPRTDAATVRMERLDGDIDEVVSADFARQLERELIAARSATGAIYPDKNPDKVSGSEPSLSVEEGAPDRPDWAQQLPGAELYDRAARYEYIRTLNPRQFAALYDEALADERFDDVVDRHRMKGEKP